MTKNTTWQKNCVYTFIGLKKEEQNMEKVMHINQASNMVQSNETME